MKARQGFASGIATLGVVLMLAPAASWSSDPDGTQATAASSSAPAHQRSHKPRHGAVRAAHPAPPHSATTGSNAAADGKPLALQAPPLSHVIGHQELRYILAYNEDASADPEDVESVNVETRKAPVTVPMGQLYALPWAFMHPTQAWRIFAPVPGQ